MPGIPDVPRHCELRNDSVVEVICQAGYDGGLQQHFVLEAIGATSTYFNNLDSTRSTHEILDNEISTMNDQVSMLQDFRPFSGAVAGMSFCLSNLSFPLT